MMQELVMCLDVLFVVVTVMLHDISVFGWYKTLKQPEKSGAQRKENIDYLAFRLTLNRVIRQKENETDEKLK